MPFKDSNLPPSNCNEVAAPCCYFIPFYPTAICTPLQVCLPSKRCTDTRNNIRFWQDLNKLGRIFYATTRIYKKLKFFIFFLLLYYTPNFLIQLSAKFLVYKVFWSNLHNFYYIQTNKNARCGEATLGTRYAHTCSQGLGCY